MFPRECHPIKINTLVNSYTEVLIFFSSYYGCYYYYYLRLFLASKVKMMSKHLLTIIKKKTCKI
jgi:hypothetical protein